MSKLLRDGLVGLEEATEPNGERVADLAQRVAPNDTAAKKCPRCWFMPCRRMFQCSEPNSEPSISELLSEIDRWPMRWPMRWRVALGERGEWQGFWWTRGKDNLEGRVSADVHEDYANELAVWFANLVNMAPALLKIATAALAYQAGVSNEHY
jgi:hypothetical protein